MNACLEKMNPDRILKITGEIIQTPAFVYDEAVVIEKLVALSDVRSRSTCRVLYSMKAAPLSGLLKTIAEYVDGFSASSLFECQIAKEILKGDDPTHITSSIHITSPGLREGDVKSIADYADYISFNSINQWKQYKNLVKERLNCGLRLNPEKSFAKDVRYDPCRKYSKLGVMVSQIVGQDLTGIQGIHVHNNCESNNFSELKQTLVPVCELLDSTFKKLQWINLGGGYFIDNKKQSLELEAIIKNLKSKYNLDVFIEPGKGVVGSAGFLVTSVVDLFASDGKQIAILDTSVNHLPEVFEYQYKPHILQESPKGKYVYRLAGCSCLSGDLFGDYYFDQPLKIGHRLTFRNVGAYMLVKANMFNGINLPTVNILKSDGTLIMEREFSYQDFRARY